MVISAGRNRVLPRTPVIACLRTVTVAAKLRMMNATRMGRSAAVGPLKGCCPRTDSQIAPRTASTATPRAARSHGGEGASLRRASWVVWSSRAAAWRGSKLPPLPAEVVASGVGFMVSPVIDSMP